MLDHFLYVRGHIKRKQRYFRVLILKNNKPRYMIVSLQDNPVLDLSDEEKTDIVARRLLKKHRKAFEELAK